MIGYGNHQSVHLTTADEVTDPLAYLLNANTPGLKETMALFRRSLINKGVIWVAQLAAELPSAVGAAVLLPSSGRGLETAASGACQRL